MLGLRGPRPPVNGRLRDIQIGGRLAQREDGAGNPWVVSTDAWLLFRGFLDRILLVSSNASGPIVAALTVAHEQGHVEKVEARPLSPWSQRSAGSELAASWPHRDEQSGSRRPRRHRCRPLLSHR